MSKLLIGLLTLVSITGYANVKCDKAINTLVAFSSAAGEGRTWIKINELKISNNQNILKLFEENPNSAYLSTCYSKNLLSKEIEENTQSIKDMSELGLNETLEYYKSEIKSACH